MRRRLAGAKDENAVVSIEIDHMPLSVEGHNQVMILDADMIDDHFVRIDPPQGGAEDLHKMISRERRTHEWPAAGVGDGIPVCRIVGAGATLTLLGMKSSTTPAPIRSRTAMA